MSNFLLSMVIQINGLKRQLLVLDVFLLSANKLVFTDEK